ncbi:hypothetical protein BJ165DRAFT_1457998 [Panaeolus papilionaceus]|nr:hypothetical protein BJ165DRAFT_1457998 [Panaeolus papilionaceus]
MTIMMAMTDATNNLSHCYCTAPSDYSHESPSDVFFFILSFLLLPTPSRVPIPVQGFQCVRQVNTGSFN